jgi:precorrin-6B methylase 2
MSVADIGAGTGALSVAVAPYIGPQGHIYATELGTESVASLAQALDSAGLTNLTVLEGHPDQTNLPQQCCEAVFIRFVYHHFANPPAMNATLWQSLKPGGRLAIIEFAPRGLEAAQPSGRAEGDQHGVTASTLQAELEQAGFTVLSTEQRPDRRVQVVAVKAPAP